MLLFKRKIVNRYFFLLFFLLLIAPGVTHFLIHENINYINLNELRHPAKFPEFPRSVNDLEQVPSKLEAYLNDRFGFRRLFITVNNYLRVKLGFKTEGKVLVGKDGWLYYTALDVISDFRGVQPLSEADIDLRMRPFRKVRDLMEKRGVKTIFMLVPDKQSVYPEYLPDWVVPLGPSRYDQMVEAFQKEKFNFLELRPALKADRNLLPTYYKTDSHWNEYGAYVAYHVLMDRMKEMYPDVECLTPRQVQFKKKETVGRDLSRMLYLSEYMIDQRYKPVFKQANFKIDLYRNGEKVKQSKWWRGNAFDSVVTTDDAKNDLRILMMRDSFAIDMIPYLVNTFSACMFTSNSTEFDKVQQEFQPDVFVWQTLERYF
ncbi:alginate O-acetyltransferase AlgX-related protein [Desulfogranum marinum]|uniref:alginate O-acetyltransferase AlgX-related protein n=1 Tax=Desulfogranum marinum TaxID=453220 RepID=UPI00196539D1|nr:hypothetical protein [Desulfogranum marinum]MBM9513033.1 hypothetical protein [Desulfogranum marinum]